MVQHLCPDDRALVDLLDGLVGHDGTPLLHVRLATVERTLEKKFDKYSCYTAASWTHADALVEAAVQGSTTCVAGTRVTKWVALDGAPSTAGNRHFEWSASGMDVGNGIDWDAGTAADRRVYKPLWNPKGHKAVSLTHRATLVVVWPRRRGLQLAASGGLTSLVNYVERRHGSGSGGSSDGIGCNATAADAAVVPVLAAADDPERDSWLPQLAFSLNSATSHWDEEDAVIRMVRLSTALGGVDLACAGVRRPATSPRARSSHGVVAASPRLLPPWLPCWRRLGSLAGTPSRGLCTPCSLTPPPMVRRWLRASWPCSRRRQMYWSSPRRRQRAHRSTMACSRRPPSLPCCQSPARRPR